MSGIDSGFTDKYLQLKNGGLEKNEIHELKKDIVYGNNNLQELNKLKNEILKDGRIDEDEAKLIVTIGFSLDENSANQVRQHLSSPTNEYITQLFDMGKKAGKNAVDTYRKDHDIKAKIRDTVDSIAKGVDDLFGTSLSEIVDNSEEAVKVNNQEVLKKLDDTLKKLKDSAQKNDCITQALKTLKVIDDTKNFKSERVTEEFLEQNTTVKNWDAIELRNYNDAGARNLLQGHENKALVVLGSHTYVFKGFNKDGKLIVSDPSSNNKILHVDRNNPSLTVFVQGNGDGKATKDTRFMEKIAKSYDNFIRFYSNDKNKTINYSDNIDKTGESFEIRKLLLLMGDPSNRITANKIFDAVSKNDLNALKEVLASKNINIDNQELRAFISVMNTPIKTEHGNSMLDEMKWLNDNGGKWTTNKVRYNVGIMYSDVNLADYFTKTKPEDVYKNFKDILEGKQGC
jgi:hypothetical protein